MALLDKADEACAEADAAGPHEEFYHAAPCAFLLRLLPPPHPLTLFCVETAQKPAGGAAWRNGSEAGDGGMDKATRAAIARAYEVGRGDGGGELTRACE